MTTVGSFANPKTLKLFALAVRSIGARNGEHKGCRRIYGWRRRCTTSDIAQAPQRWVSMEPTEKPKAEEECIRSVGSKHSGTAMIQKEWQRAGFEVPLL